MAKPRKTRIMGSQVYRNHVNRDGLPKRAFASPEEAYKFLDITHTRDKCKVYQCKLCDKWHLATRKVGRAD